MRSNFKIRNYFNNIVFRSLNILNTKDKIKVFTLVAIQIFLSFLDLAGVAVIGVIGAMTINGSASRPPGERVTKVLEFLQIDNFSLSKQVAILGLIAALLLVGKTVSTIFLTRRTMFFLGNRASLITKDLIYKLLNQSIQEIQRRSVQENVFLVTNGVTSITNGIISTTISLLADTFLLVIMISGLFYVDYKVALLTILIFGSIAFTLYILTHIRAKNLGVKQANLSIRSIEMIQEVISSFREAVVGGRQTFYSEEIGKQQSSLARNQAELSFLPSIGKYVLEITIVLGFLLISAVTFSQNDAARSVAVISVFLAASTRIGPAVLRLQQVSIAIKGVTPSAERTLSLIETFNKNKINKGAVNRFTNVHEGFIGKVKVTNVQFTYEGNSNPTLKNISLEFNSGDVVALVGRSGSGKTTLADVIIGVLRPDIGEVKISNIISSEIPHNFAGAIAYVPQDVFIANGTVRSNITLGYASEEITDKEIWDALNTAQLFDVVNKLPYKLDTPIGDRGSKLSGGQRQRLGIARALITKPMVLILDEATSSLDSQTELDISEAILNLGGETTVIIIAHRLSTVKKVKTIAYMDNGEIKAIGSFEQVRNSVKDFNIQAKLLGI